MRDDLTDTSFVRIYKAGAGPPGEFNRGYNNTHPIRFHNSLTESLMLAYDSSSKPKYTDLKQSKKKKD